VCQQVRAFKSFGNIGKDKCVDRPTTEAPAAIGEANAEAGEGEAEGEANAEAGSEAEGEANAEAGSEANTEAGEGEGEGEAGEGTTSLTTAPCCQYYVVRDGVDVCVECGKD